MDLKMEAAIAASITISDQWAIIAWTISSPLRLAG